MSVMADVDREIEHVFALEIPCDYQQNAERFKWPCPDHPAAWVAHIKCPSCGVSGERLICTPCKDYAMTAEGGGVCRNCDEVCVPFRRCFARLEPLSHQ